MRTHPALTRIDRRLAQIEAEAAALRAEIRELANAPSDTRPLTVPEAAEALGIGRTKAWQMVRDGSLPTIRLGGSTRVTRHALNRLLEIGA